jgi:hypothetical protein
MAGGVVAPREYHRASRWYLAAFALMYDLCYTPLRKAEDLPPKFFEHVSK